MVVVLVPAAKCKPSSAPAAAKKSKGESAGRGGTEACQEEGQLEGDAGEGIHSRCGCGCCALLLGRRGGSCKEEYICTRGRLVEQWWRRGSDGMAMKGFFICMAPVVGCVGEGIRE